MKLLNKAYKYFWSLVEKNDKKRMDKQIYPDGINAVVDIPYIDDGRIEHLMDIYYPGEKRDNSLPVILDVHGGGLMYGYKELNKNYCYNLAKRGFNVVNISYSLCPDFSFPLCLQDVMAAIKYIGENADYYSLNKDKMFITGDSAGALLAAYAVLLNTSEELRTVYEVKKTNIDFKAIGLTSGMFFFDSGLAKFLSPGIFGKGGKRKSPYKNYLAFCDIIDKGEFPPAYLVTSKEDMIEKSTLMFQELLEDREIENTLHHYKKGEEHKLEHVFSVLYPVEYDESREVIDEMTNFFLAHC